MIHKNNIAAFISYAYKLRNRTEAPETLIDKWKQIPANELDLRIDQLFDSWNYDTAQRKKVISDFLSLQNINQNIPQAPLISNRKKYNFTWLWAILFFVFAVGAVYTGIKYFQYKNLHYVYTLTDRVAMRNENREQIGTMDITPNRTGASYQRLLVADRKIYHKAIDSTEKLYDHRKVYLDNLSFMDYLQDNEEKYAYINAKFVVDSKEEYELYKKLFGQLIQQDNKRLQLKHRKIIANSLSFNPALKGLYVLSSCVNASEKARRNNIGLLIHEIIPDNKYEIIAKLSDGNYYQFIGDLLSNQFAAPKRIGYVEEPNRADEFLQGDLLFRYLSVSKKYVLTNCSGTVLPYEAVLNTEGVILYFQKKEVKENPVEPIIEFGEEAADFINDLENMVDKILK